MVHKSKFDRYSKQALSTVYSEPETPNFHLPLIHQAVDNVLPLIMLAKDSKVLDIGCGQGTFMKYMVQKGYDDLIGVTLNIDDVNACEDEGFKTLCSDFTDLDVQDESIDLIWCRHALEHSPYPIFSLMEFNRILKQDKYLYVEVPAPNIDVRCHENNSNHYSVFGDRMWISLFLKTGFRIVQYQQIEFELIIDGNKVRELFYSFILRKERAFPCNQ